MELGQNWTVSHDFAFVLGGAERVTAAIADALAGAPVLVFSGQYEVLSSLAKPESRVSTLEPKFVNESNYRPLLLAHLIAARSTSVDGNLFASSYGFSHMLRASGEKIVYCHSPLRQSWSGLADYAATLPAAQRALWTKVFAPMYRRIDRSVSKEVDTYIATSRAVQSRIWEFYNRESVILPPPVDPIFFTEDSTLTRDDFFLWAGRIVEPYKRLGLLIEAIRGTENTLVVVGDGRDRARLEEQAPANVVFVGSKSTAELASYYKRARALIMPSEDDFGMVATEAIASGTPVIAWGRGGALDTVTPGLTGVLYKDPSIESIRGAINEFDRNCWDAKKIRDAAQAYSVEHFKEQVRKLTRA